MAMGETVCITERDRKEKQFRLRNFVLSWIVPFLPSIVGDKNL